MSAFPFPFPSPFGSGFSFAPGGGGTPLSLLDATPVGAFGQSDQLIDPTTFDYVRNDVGEWAETADSRSIVMLMIELELGASPFEPNDGTTIKSRMRDGDPVSAEEIRAETLRACQILESAGVISDLSVRVRDANGELLRDQSGRFMVSVDWRDLASGSSANFIVQPG